MLWKKPWVTPCPVKDPGRKGGQARWFRTKNEIGDAFLIGFRKSLEDSFPKEMALEWLTSCSYIHFFSLCHLYAFSHTVCSSWNAPSPHPQFLPILCISAGFSEPLRPGWDVPRARKSSLICPCWLPDTLQLVSPSRSVVVSSYTFVRPARLTVAGWMDDGVWALLA